MNQLSQKTFLFKNQPKLTQKRKEPAEINNLIQEDDESEDVFEELTEDLIVFGIKAASFHDTFRIDNVMNDLDFNEVQCD